MANVHVDTAFRRVLDSIKQLPSPPEVCLRVTTAIHDEDTTLADLQTLVESDMALSGRLIQVANSAFFATRQRVASVRRAITLMGFVTVRELALGFFLNDEFSKLHSPGLPYPQLPQYAVASSVVAETIAQRTCPDLVGEAVCLGLLHESGVVVMAMAFGSQYHRMLAALPTTEQALADAETETFAMDHAKAGQLLLTGWKLSDSFTQAVASHHKPQPEDCQSPEALELWKILSLASTVALLFFHPKRPGLVAQASRLAQDHFDWTGDELRDILVTAEPAYRARTSILGLADNLALDLSTPEGSSFPTASEPTAAFG